MRSIIGLTMFKVSRYLVYGPWFWIEGEDRHITSDSGVLTKSYRKIEFDFEYLSTFVDGVHVPSWFLLLEDLQSYCHNMHKLFSLLSTVEPL